MSIFVVLWRKGQAEDRLAGTMTNVTVLTGRGNDRSPTLSPFINPHWIGRKNIVSGREPARVVVATFVGIIGSILGSKSSWDSQIRQVDHLVLLKFKLWSLKFQGSGILGLSISKTNPTHLSWQYNAFSNRYKQIRPCANFMMLQFNDSWGNAITYPFRSVLIECFQGKTKHPGRDRCRKKNSKTSPTAEEWPPEDSRIKNSNRNSHDIAATRSMTLPRYRTLPTKNQSSWYWRKPIWSQVYLIIYHLKNISQSVQRPFEDKTYP